MFDRILNIPPDYLSWFGIVSREINGKVDIPYRGKKSRGKFSSGKNVVTSKKISHFSLTNFSNSSLSLNQFLKFFEGLS